MTHNSSKKSPAPAASPADWSAWASVPWTPLTGPAPDSTNPPTDTDNTILGWHKAGVPYLPGGAHHSLQTLDVWLPASASPTTITPDPSSLPQDTDTHSPGTWIIYIHGGAWRDPRITAASFASAATKLLQSSTSSPERNGRIAGLASLNYRLSPHPSHPDLTENSARHPDHIRDVLTGLSFLQRLLPGDGMGEYVLTGHSCGATLAFQAVMNPSRWGLSSDDGAGVGIGVKVGVVKPAVVVGFNGLYDLAGFIASPPAGYEGLKGAYEEFVRGAFGEDEERGWRAACPTSAREGWVGEWIGDGGGDGDGGKKKVAVLVQSREDTLVPYQQLEGLRGVVEGDGRVEVRVLEAGGDHDDIWKEGGRMAEVLGEFVEGLV